MYDAEEKVLPKKKTRSKTSMDNRGNTTKNEGKEKKYKGTVTYTKLDKEIKSDCIKAKEIWAKKNVKRLKDSPKD